MFDVGKLFKMAEISSITLLCMLNVTIDMYVITTYIYIFIVLHIKIFISRRNRRENVDEYKSNTHLFIGTHWIISKGTNN